MGLDMYLYGERVVESNDDFTDYIVRHLQVAYWRKANAIHRFFCGLADGEDEGQNIPVKKSDLEKLVEKCNIILGMIAKEGVDISTPESIFNYGRVESQAIVFNNSGYEASKEVIAKCEELLPTQGGFFFGGVEYSNIYFYHLKETVDMLAPIIDEWGDGGDWKSEDGWRYIYQASW